MAQTNAVVRQGKGRALPADQRVEGLWPRQWLRHVPRRSVYTRGVPFQTDVTVLSRSLQPPKAMSVPESGSSRVPSFSSRADTFACGNPAASHRMLYCAACILNRPAFPCVTQYIAHVVYTGMYIRTVSRSQRSTSLRSRLLLVWLRLFRHMLARATGIGYRFLLIMPRPAVITHHDHPVCRVRIEDSSWWCASRICVSLRERSGEIHNAGRGFPKIAL